jgi:hypothetical protein
MARTHRLPNPVRQIWPETATAVRCQRGSYWGKTGRDSLLQERQFVTHCDIGLRNIAVLHNAANVVLPMSQKEPYAR